MSMTHQEYERWKQQDAVTLPRAAQEEEQYRSVVDKQMMELQTQLNFLRSVVETLERRLHPVLADVPVKSHEQEKLTAAMSPVASAFYEACQKINRESMNLQSLLERLEV